MASHFSLQKPYVVASLPQPIDRLSGGYQVGEVYGGAPGAKKRKRSELAVGIDGEGVNIYDIPSSRLITSYALPPQSSFTCPPSSVRTRISKTKVERRTYSSTRNPHPEINLFHEIAENSIPSNTSTASRKVEKSKSPIIYLGTVISTDIAQAVSNVPHLISVKEDGEIQCYDGETLVEKWTSPPSALMREAASPVSKLSVEFVHQTDVHSACQTIFKGRPDILSIFPEENATQGNTSPEILVIVSKSIIGKAPFRTFHVVHLPRRSKTQFSGQANYVESLVTIMSPLTPAQKDTKNKPYFSMRMSVGLLQLLENGMLTTLDISGSVLKEQSRIICPGAQSFLRLSNTSVMVSADDSITVYNSKYQSRLAGIQIGLSDKDGSLKRKRKTLEENDHPASGCRFVSYFPKLALAIAIADNNLLAVQVDGQQDRLGKPRAGGLLVDSLGASAGGQARLEMQESTQVKLLGQNSGVSILPGNLVSDDFSQQRRTVDEALSQDGNTEEFDNLIARYAISEGVMGTTSSSDIDRRWVVFILSKIFSWADSKDSDPKLRISFYPPQTFMLLVTNGYVTTANIETALRNYQGITRVVPSGQLIDAIVRVDSGMELLLVLIAKNYLGAADLLHGIKLLIASLEPTGESEQKLLTNGDAMEITTDSPGYTVHEEALSLALSKLYLRPNNSIITSLQTTYTSEDIIILVNHLRYELANGSWTSRYIDDIPASLDPENTSISNPPSILQISTLLNACIDALGSGGFLTSSSLPSTTTTLITTLKLEITAALEGLQESTYLLGLTNEIITYSHRLQTLGENLPTKSNQKLEATNVARREPIRLKELDRDDKVLPLGLRVERKAIKEERLKVGGEVKMRSQRDLKYLRGLMVPKYVREKVYI